jgi:hypothetical protein
LNQTLGYAQLPAQLPDGSESGRLPQFGLFSANREHEVETVTLVESDPDQSAFLLSQAYELRVRVHTTWSGVVFQFLYRVGFFLNWIHDQDFHVHNSVTDLASTIRIG